MNVHRPVHANVHSAPFSTAPGPGIPEMMSHRREVLLEQVKLSRTVMLLSGPRSDGANELGTVNPAPPVTRMRIVGRS
jgi:hypothetical protein